MILSLLSITFGIIACVALGFIALVLLTNEKMSEIDEYYRKERERLSNERKERHLEHDIISVKMHSRCINKCYYITYEILNGIINEDFRRSRDTKPDLVPFIRYRYKRSPKQGHDMIRFKNPFILTDDEKIDLIKKKYEQSFINLLLYGFKQEPSDYLKNSVNKMKLTIGLPEQDKYVDIENMMQEIDIDQDLALKIEDKFLLDNYVY